MSIGDQTRPSPEHLGSRLEFETLISDTSASLFAAQPDQLDRAVEHALGRVRDFFHADRCALLSVSADQQVVNVRLGSYAEGIEPVPTGLNLATMFPWSHRTLLVDRTPVRVSRIADLPPNAVTEREAWMQMPIRSALTLPIESGGDVSHLIVLNTVHEECEWPDAFVKRLRLLGEMIVGALQRRDAFTRLLHAEERLNLAADSAEAGLWVLDCRTRVFWATEQARALFEFSPDEMISMERFEASVHPDDRGLVRSVVDRSLHERDSLYVEYRIRLGEGRVRWIASRGRPRFSPSGEPESLMGVSMDITERRRAEEEHRKSEARLASGADLAGLAYYEVDYDERVAYVDDQFRKICGVPHDIQQSFQSVEFWMEHLHPDDRQGVLNLREELHTGRVDRVSIEYRYLTPTHGEKWIHHLARVSRRDATGRAVATFGALRDVTKRKQVENELRDLSRRLIRAHEEERALLARELHDDVTQRLAVLAIDVGRAEVAAQDGAQVEAMRAAREELARLSEDIHSMAYQLHPAVLEELGLVEALRCECERRVRQGRLDLKVDLDPASGVVRKEAALSLFRVAQEALNNAARHAGTRAASVTLRQMNGGSLLAVRDGGAGFDPENPGTGRHLGLASMRERMRLVNGTLDVESTPGRGTTIVAWVPAEQGVE